MNAHTPVTAQDLLASVIHVDASFRLLGLADRSAHQALATVASGVWATRFGFAPRVGDALSCIKQNFPNGPLRTFPAHLFCSDVLPVIEDLHHASMFRSSLLMVFSSVYLPTYYMYENVSVAHVLTRLGAETTSLLQLPRPGVNGAIVWIHSQ